MKILIMNDLIAGGGVENVMQELVRYLQGKGHNITIGTTTGSRKEVHKYYPSGVHFFSIEPSFAYTKNKSIARLFYALCSRLKRWWALLLMKTKYDIAIAMKEGPTMKEVVLSGAKKKIAWVHTDYQRMHWTAYCFDSDEEEVACMKKFDHVICVSNAVADSIKNTIGDSGNLIVKYNPINYKRIISLAEQSSVIKKPQDKFLFVAVGRIVDEKNYHLLVNVCAELKKKHDFELWILGDGDQRAEIESIVNQLECSFVHMLGNQENPYPLIRQADCLVSASKVESYGLAIQEALVLGVPVVTTKCPAIKEVFDARCGILCDSTFDGLYKAMETVIMEPALLHKYRENIKRYFRLEDLYENRLVDICSLWGLT